MLLEITELEAPKDYQLNTQPQQVTVATGETKEITITNKKIEKTGNLTITKVDAADNNIKLEGAKFEIVPKVTDALGTITNSATYVFKENNGVFTSNNIGLNNTIARSYMKIDLTGKIGKFDAIVNAQVSSEKDYDFGFAAITQTTTAPSFDYRTEVEGQFIKTSGTSNTATDYIYKDLEGGNVYYLHLAYAKDGATRSGDDSFTVNSIYLEQATEAIEVTTNNEGIAQVPLIPGEYIIKEIKAPEGYILNKERQSIVILNGNNEIILNNTLNKFNITTKIEKEWYGLLENEKRIVDSIAKALSGMTEFEKGYILGIAESRLSEKREKQQKKIQTISSLLPPLTRILHSHRNPCAQPEILL
mgnify:CR=1 FL=1